MPDRRISLRELLWLLCAMGIPLLVLPLAYSKFELPKVMTLQGIVLVLAIATLVEGNRLIRSSPIHTVSCSGVRRCTAQA